MTSQLLAASHEVLDELGRNIPTNVDRYLSGDFASEQKENGWAIVVRSVSVDHSLLASLDGGARTAEADARNAELVYAALKGMTPALAREERIWVRLAHVECLEYSRLRWLRAQDPDKSIPEIKKHFFAPSLTAIRDDHAIARLWWTMHIAQLIEPQDPRAALEVVSSKAEIRQGLVERPGIGTRIPLARAVIGALRRSPELMIDAQFRKFMTTINLHGGGLLLEALPESAVEGLVRKCAEISMR